MPKKSSTSYRLTAITTEQFAFIEDAFNRQDEDIDFSVRLGVGVDSEEKMLGLSVEYRFLQKEKVFLICEVACHYHISRFGNWEERDGKHIVPRGFIEYLSNMSAATTRGILHAKTEHTPVHHLIAPMLNMEEMELDEVVM